MEKRKLVIMLLNTEPDRPWTLGAPFFQAIVATTLDLEVEMYFASRNVALFKPGVAEELFPGEDNQKSVYSFMQDAHEAGVKFYACGGAMDENDLTMDNAIPELDGAAGGAAFIGEVIEDDVATLTY
ncbi:DsrE/DsrF/DrsH-like family protein [Thiohalospira sp.]|uniref:DsrE/DsrF/DrsH-like family protein n=1 Tax=Thiohalospira sp. TaxID=3080549 RepID=UPI00398163F4